MGRTGMFFSTLAIAAGAVMHWAVTTTGHGFNVSTVGIILMIVGVIRAVGSGKRTYDRQATNAQGQSTEVHEEVHS
ncbi:MAG: hypothetical protein ABSD85_15470 [Acidimicrobiales bacterium]